MLQIPTHGMIFFCDSDTVVSRNAWNEAYVRLVTAETGITYTLTVDDDTFTYISDSKDSQTILDGIAALVQIEGIETSVSDSLLTLKCTSPEKNASLGTVGDFNNSIDHWTGKILNRRVRINRHAGPDNQQDHQ